MSKFIFLLFITFLLTPILTDNCVVGENFCVKCDDASNKCLECKYDILKPDENNGGCVGAQVCAIGENYCQTCNVQSTLCQSCDSGYYADLNGGCANTENCEISYRGVCLKCSDDFYLVGSNLKVCKYKYLDDLKNCKSVNYESGFCEECEEGFFLNSIDKKCINTANCAESSFGVCKKCDNGYYLDKTNDVCNTQTENFLNCIETIDGNKCFTCEDGYYLAEKEGKCTYTNYCLKVGNSSLCEECENGYYVSGDKYSCTTEQNCYYGNKDNGKCTYCGDGFYLDKSDDHCKSNLEDNDLKYCKIFENVCKECDYLYFLDAENKCTNSEKCTKSDKTKCLQCENNFYLGSDNKCSQFEHCANSTYYYNCEKCADNYYFNDLNKTCDSAINQFENCHKSDNNNTYCLLCNKGFYLKDNKCNSNQDASKDFYKCEKLDSSETYCVTCEEGYYLNSKDKKCSLIEGCAISENENKCTECDKYSCLDLKKNICEYKYLPPINEEKKIYYLCNKTNNEGTECAECENEKLVLINGICVNKYECEEEKDGQCVKCKDKSEDGVNLCLNDWYGCVETNVENCLRCNGVFDYDICNECKEGYELTEEGCN